MGEAFVDRAAIRFNPTLGRLEFREFSHAVSQNTGRTLQGWISRAIRPFSDVNVNLDRFVNHPLNGNMRWGIEHALEDSFRFNFVPRDLKPYFAPMQKNGIELLRARTPEWISPTVASSGTLIRSGLNKSLTQR